MAQAMTGMTQFMTQQAQVNAAQAAENCQRHAADEARQVQRQQREEAAAQTKGLSDFRRHYPPKFLGGTDPEKADLWIQEVEKIFTVLHTPEEVKLDYAAYLLTGSAEYCGEAQD
jgi:type II secretory pathway pseudopilin PulG